jgi:hypothetical protein
MNYIYLEYKLGLIYWMLDSCNGKVSLKKYITQEKDLVMSTSLLSYKNTLYLKTIDRNYNSLQSRNSQLRQGPTPPPRRRAEASVPARLGEEGRRS